MANGISLKPVADHIQNLETNIAEVKRLLEIHEELVGASQGRKHNVEVLNKSAIVLLVACWEAFVEDLASTAFEAMLTHAPDHSIFPDDVLTQASKKLKAAPDNREVWRLAGTGWLAVLADHKSDLFKEYIGKLNTPKPKQIDALFSSLIGVQSLSAKWIWPKSDADKAKKKLTALIELRGSIAHRVATSQSVRKAAVTGYMDFIYRLAVISSNHVRTFVRARTKIRTKKQPWGSYRYGKIR
jgi:hypothetical protein